MKPRDQFEAFSFQVDRFCDLVIGVMLIVGIECATVGTAVLLGKLVFG